MSFILGFVYLKNSIYKINKPYAFYLSIKDYKIFPNKALPLFVPFLVSVEVVLGIVFIVPNTKWFMLIPAIFLQIFYLFITIALFGKEFKKNCNCFANTPRNIEIRNVMSNFVLLILIVLLISIRLQTEI